MPTRTQIRFGVKWGGALLAAILIGLLVHSRWATIGWAFPNGFAFGVQEGSLGIAGGSLPQGFNPPPPGMIYLQYGASFKWWFDWGSYSMRWYFSVPLWILILLSAVSASWAWRKDVMERRRKSVGLCHTCGYDRGGIEENAKCPECGKSLA